MQAKGYASLVLRMPRDGKSATGDLLPREPEKRGPELVVQSGVDEVDIYGSTLLEFSLTSSVLSRTTFMRAARKRTDQTA